MTIRFFILQAHYRSTLDFSNEALQAAEKGMKKLLGVAEIIEKLQPSKSTSINVEGFHNKLYDAINDDFNTPIAIAHLFDLSKIINQVNDGKATLTKSDIEKIKKLYSSFVYDILGLKNDSSVSTDDSLVSDLMETILTLRKNAKDNKDWATADKIRDELAKLNISVKDTKDGADWSID